MTTSILPGRGGRSGVLGMATPRYQDVSDGIENNLDRHHSVGITSADSTSYPSESAQFIRNEVCPPIAVRLFSPTHCIRELSTTTHPI